MDTITEALKKIIPADQVNEVAKAVEEMVNEQVAALEREFQAKLDEAYEQISEEKKADEAIAEQGYEQAYSIIHDLRNRLDEQRKEFEQVLEQEFEEAYKELQAEKVKNENLEVELYDEFDSKLKNMQEFMVDKVDQFLALQEKEIYECAKRDVLSDPSVMEQKVAVEKMAGILSDYMDRDDLSGVTSKQLEEAHKSIEELKGQLRIVESRNVKLSAQNNKLNEQVQEANGLITEAKKMTKKERQEKAQNASGRGHRVAEQVIAEYAAPKRGEEQDQNLVESDESANDLLVLSGIQEN